MPSHPVDACSTPPEPLKAAVVATPIFAQTTHPTPPAPLVSPSSSAPLAGTLAIAAEGNIAEMIALQSVLRAEGMRVEMVSDTRELLELACRRAPQVILLDSALPGLDVRETTRILARHPITASAAILLVAPHSADARLMRRLKELDAFTLLRRPLTCATIRSVFHDAVAYARQAASLRQPEFIDSRPRKIVADCDALLHHELLCPFHPFEVKVNYYELRTSRVHTQTDLFDLPVYRKASREGDDVNYHYAGLAVCHECLFASNDPGYFVDPDRPPTGIQLLGRQRYDIDPATHAAIRDTTSQRNRLVHERLGVDPSPSFHRFDRSPHEALLAYELAIESSRILYEAAPVRRNSELLRLGNYELRRAMISAALGADRVEVDALRRQALSWLMRACDECAGYARYKAAYQLVALHVHLDDDATALRYLNALKKMNQRRRRDQSDPVALERYLRRAQNVWGERHIHRQAADRID